MIGFLKRLSAPGISMTLSYLHFTSAPWLWRSRIAAGTRSSLVPAQAGAQGACLPGARGLRLKLHGAGLGLRQEDMSGTYVAHMSSYQERALSIYVFM